jgi:hypothetical protein
MLEAAQAKGEMVLEEKVLVEAERNPELAFRVLQERQKKEDRKEDKEEVQRRSIWEIMNDGAKERGIIQEGEIVEDILK